MFLSIMVYHRTLNIVPCAIQLLLFSCIVPFIIFKSNKNPILEITLKINFGGEGNGNPLHIPARRTPWTEEPSGLHSMGSQRVRYD